MPRRVQDIVPGDRRSIRDVRIGGAEIPKEGKISIKKSDTNILRNRMPITPPPDEMRPKRPSMKRGKWLLISLGVVVVVAGIAFMASTHYSKASFTIKAKSIPIQANGMYVAQGSPAKDVLAYELITIKGAASTSIAATEGPKISTKAQGKVTLYNAYSIKPVRLIAGTRVANDSGLIYHLPSSVTIPGYTKPLGGILPGTLSVSIIADQPGPEYNVGRGDSLSDFKIVAYKGTARYDVVYARIAGDISGGFLGSKKIVSPSALASTTAQLKSSITASLLSQLKGAVPEGFIMFDSAYSLSFAPVVVDGSSKNSATVNEYGIANGILLKKTNLISKLSAGQSDLAFGKFGYTEQGLEELQVSITNIKDFSPDKKSSLVFRVKGDMKLVGAVPVEEIRQKLQGISLAATQDIFKSYGPVIETGSGELVPLWAKIPNDPKRISITVQE